MNFLFLLQYAKDAYSHKRMRNLVSEGVTPLVLGFDRDHYPADDSCLDYISFGQIEHGSYGRRIMKYLKAMWRVIQVTRNQDVIYCFGFDMLMIAIISKLFTFSRVKLVYEVADIRPIQLKKGLVSQLIRLIERLMLKLVTLVVVTSPAYIESYYKKVLNANKCEYIVVENKLDATQEPQKNNKIINKKNRDYLVVGFFGVLRCERSWEILKLVALKSDGRVKVLLRGVPLSPKDIEEQSQSIENLSYAGPYKSPIDLPSLYDSVDLVWACAPYDETDLGDCDWKRTNRFYESCYFGKPLICQRGTEDSKVVQEKDLGLVLDLSDVESSVEKILSLSQTDIMSYQTNVLNLPEKSYCYTQEHQNIIAMLSR